jgi:hypothetical protein
VAEISVLLDAPGGKVDRPALLLRRGRLRIDQADLLRREKSTNPAMGGIFATPDENRRFDEYFDLSWKDLQEILTAFPYSAEAPEAQFLVGLIHDFPNLSNFDEALTQYRKTVDLFPGTPAANRALERIAVIMRIQGGMEGTGHGPRP